MFSDTVTSRVQKLGCYFILFANFLVNCIQFTRIGAEKSIDYVRSFLGPVAVGQVFTNEVRVLINHYPMAVCFRMIPCDSFTNSC